MSNVTISARRADTKSDLYDNNNKIVTQVEIKKNTNMEISIGSGFSSAAEITSFTLYPVLADGTKDAAHPIGTWNRATPGTPASTEITVAATASGAIEVTDTDSQPNDELFFFSITVTDGGVPYISDPQLKVKKTVG
ncbi:MAG: hypothetical protein QNL91_10945 [Candidatus Krumholzibacteria bacterium]|nr:hypothetical protein [Candidatus Krumholzibacteria bacterium]